jgi:rhodanese-related sulfurtransferase
MNVFLDQRRRAFWLPAAALALGIVIHQSSGYDVKNVSVAEAGALVDSGAMVVDVRSKDAYDARHIPGALNIPVALLREAIPAVLASSKALPVVVYCGDGARIGPEGTSLLNKAGYTKAVNVEKGIQGWADAGRRVAVGGAH